MESFVHLRKGKTPRRAHADLEGQKDDELGRGGFTGRTANLYRREDPTAFRAVGPLRPRDVLSSELKPSDATDADGGPLLMFSNEDCQVLLSRRAPSAAEEGRIAALSPALEVMSGDVSDERDVQRVLARIASSPCPLRGIVHAAGVSEDSALAEQSPGRVASWSGASKLQAGPLATTCRLASRSRKSSSLPGFPSGALYVSSRALVPCHRTSSTSTGPSGRMPVIRAPRVRSSSRAIGQSPPDERRTC